MKALSLALALIAAGSAPAAQAPLPAGEVWVVDWVGGPGSDFTTIDAAIAAAADGDVVLVRPGGYAPFVIDGKALQVVGDVPDSGDPASFPTISNFPHGIEVRGLAPSQSVVLRNLAVPGLDIDPRTDLTVDSCQGPVLIETCRFEHGHPCAEVRASADVTFVRTTLDGADGFLALTFAGGRALESVGSEVQLFDCELRGGDGRDGVAFTYEALAPTESLRVEDGILYASGSAFVGGAGGDAATTYFGQCYAATDGADAVLLVGTAQALALECILQPGAGGAPHWSCPGGAPGQPVGGAAAAWSVLPGLARSCAVQAPLRAGETATVSVSGEPGDVVVLGFSTYLDALFVPLLSGAVILGAPVHQAQLGVVDPSGVLTLIVPAPNPAGDALALALQVVCVNPTAGAVVVSAPSLLLSLDPSF